MAKKQKVLIVDDEKTIADTLGKIFSMQGYEIRVAYSAEESLGIVTQWQPELAIIDVVLPEMNGIDLAILLRANHPSIHVLLISGQLTTGQLINQAAEQGHKFQIFPKPTPVPELLAGVANLLHAQSGAS